MSNYTNDEMTFMFFNEEEVRTVEAITSRLIPGDSLNPGAKEAGAVLFIDRSLAGFFSHLQAFYRKGIFELNNYCKEQYEKTFSDLSPEEQDTVLSTIDGSNREGQHELSLLEQFFEVVYEHTLEGTFGDPLYGGNKNKIGWKMIGFPGVYWGYTTEQMSLGYDTSKMEVLSLEDLKKIKKR